MAANSDYTRRRPDTRHNLKHQSQHIPSRRYNSFSQDIDVPPSRYSASYDYTISSSASREPERKQAGIKRARKTHKISRGAFLTLLVVFVLAFTVALGSAKITSLNNRIDKLNDDLSNAEAINQKIQIDIEQSTDLKAIEEYATNELKMSRPESHQTVYINPKQPDMVEIDEPSGFISFMKKLWSYIG